MKVTQWRGLLFEEIILCLLCKAGYRRLGRLDKSIKDDGGNGLKVLGRGAYHQADAIVEFPFSPAFTFPLRLIAEAKAYSKAIELDIVRNSVGVLKDVHEVWDRIDARDPEAFKFQYAYTIFSLSRFSDPAVDYAFVQGIGLVSLSGTPWATLVKKVKEMKFGGMAGSKPSEVRNSIRRAFDSEDQAGVPQLKGFSEVRKEMRKIPFLLVGMLKGGLPLVLIPRSDMKLEDLRDPTTVRIRQARGVWYIETRRGELLFYFVMPQRLLDIYGSKEGLRRFELKSRYFDEINILYFANGSPKAIRLKIDHEWLRETFRPGRDPRERLKGIR